MERPNPFVKGQRVRNRVTDEFGVVIKDWDSISLVRI